MIIDNMTIPKSSFKIDTTIRNKFHMDSAFDNGVYRTLYTGLSTRLIKLSAFSLDWKYQTILYKNVPLKHC